MAAKSTKPTEAPAEEAALSPEPDQQPADSEAAAEVQPEAPADEPVAEAPAEEAAAEEASEEAVDPELAKINAAVRPMRAADGSEGSCDLYKSDKAGNILVPASDVAAMVEHGFVLVDEA